ncbi:MAG TPA: prolyl oligopeptidase family serine peptidase [Candidatus Binatia bacterium]|nr:prolyl oligopeptidase family serine peptidase [Candidatus Binatia bacterium]
MKIARLLQAVFLSLSLFAFGQTSFLPKPPDTPKHPVVDEYQGVKVIDDYRWLENWDDPLVKQWSAAQNARTRVYLDRVPSRAAIKARLKELIGATPPSYYYLQFRSGMLFAMKDEPPKQQPMLVVMRSAEDPASARTIIDPNASSAKGSLSIDFYVPSSDAKYVAAAMSENGSEDSSAYVFDVAAGKQIPDVVPRVNFATAGGSIAWKGDSSGFYYTRFPQGNERPPEDANFYQQVYFHKLGTDPKQDTYVIGKDFPRIAEIQLRTSEDGRWLLASVGNGDGGQFAHYVMDASGRWTQITHFEEGVVYAAFGSGEGSGDNLLYLLSRKNAPRGQILRLSLTKPDLGQAKIVVPQSAGAGADESARASIDYFVATSGHLFVVDVLGGPSRIRLFDDQGKTLEAPVVPPVSAIGQIVRLSGGDVLLNTSTHLQPPAWYRFEAATGKTTRTALFQTSPVKYDDAEVVRDFATSRDGTRVPLSIIRRKGTTLDGTHPVLLTGYGGFGVSEQPYFLGSFARVWLDLGGVFVDTNLRGGSEYGEEWHTSGNLTHKQNVFDDFLACAQYLIDNKYTSPAHLAIIGGSNGGLLMGAAFTQRPDLFRAAVSSVGIYDMLRVELDPNGQFNTTEYGSVKDLEQFKALYAYSPYHHVKDGTAYPAILMPTGENDHRVNPMQSRKMIARLQAADNSGHPILLRTSSSAGHGFGTSLDEAIEENADIFSFLFDQLGMEYAEEKR